MVNANSPSSTVGPTKPVKRGSGWFRTCLALVLGSILVICCVGVVLVVIFTPLNRPIAAFGLPRPDYGYMTGTVFGYNVYVWECYSGKRIAVYNHTSEMTASAYQREEVPCGGQTPIEKSTASDSHKAPLDMASW